MSFSGFSLSGFGGHDERESGDRVVHEQRRLATRTELAVGTLSCSGCDAPVAPGPLPLRPADELTCPFCRRVAPVRDFLSLAPPTRPARVVVRVALPPS